MKKYYNYNKIYNINKNKQKNIKWNYKTKIKLLLI